MQTIMKVVLLIGDAGIRKIIHELIQNEEQFKIIDEQSQSVSCSKIVNNLKPDLIFIDENIEPLSGMILAKKIKQNMPLIKIIFMNRDYKDSEYRNDRYPFIDLFFDQHNLFDEFEKLRDRILVQNI